MKEIWKDIEGYEKFYQVSNLGRVKSLDRIDRLGRKRPGRVLKSNILKNGYSINTLCIDGKCTGFLTHRLVAVAFLENPKDKPQVNHIDGVKTNNLVINLEFATPSENLKHAYKAGLATSKKGKDSKLSTLTEEEVLVIRRLWSKGFSLLEISDKSKVGRSGVYGIIVGRTWSELPWETGTSPVRVENNATKIETVKKIKSMHLNGYSIESICIEVNCKKKNVRRIINGERHAKITPDNSKSGE